MDQLVCSIAEGNFSSLYCNASWGGNAAVYCRNVNADVSNPIVGDAICSEDEGKIVQIVIFLQKYLAFSIPGGDNAKVFISVTFILFCPIWFRWAGYPDILPSPLYCFSAFWYHEGISSLSKSRKHFFLCCDFVAHWSESCTSERPQFGSRFEILWSACTVCLSACPPAAYWSYPKTTCQPSDWLFSNPQRCTHVRPVATGCVLKCL